MNLVFMGTPEFALPTLKALHQSPHVIQAVVTQPDRPKGRGRGMQASPVKQYAVSTGLPVLQPEKASAPEFIAVLQNLQPDVIVVIAYGQILKESLLQVPRHFCMNIHASLLPKYRGAAPINWAIINGEKETGVTTMKMDKGLDTGDMLLTRRVPIEDDDTAQDLHDRLAVAGAELAIATLDALERGTLTPVPQDPNAATYAPKLEKEHGLLNWEQDAASLRNWVRGLDPWPGAYGFLNGKRLKICRAVTGPGEPGDEPGVIARISDYGIEVGTGRGRLIITELQPEGKKRMTAKSWLQGHHLQPGDRFEASPANPSP